MSGSAPCHSGAVVPSGFQGKSHIEPYPVKLGRLKHPAQCPGGEVYQVAGGCELIPGLTLMAVLETRQVRRLNQEHPPRLKDPENLPQGLEGALQVLDRSYHAHDREAVRREPGSLQRSHEDSVGAQALLRHLGRQWIRVHAKDLVSSDRREARQTAVPAPHIEPGPTGNQPSNQFDIALVPSFVTRGFAEIVEIP